MKFLKSLATMIVVFALIGFVSMGLLEKVSPGEIEPVSPQLGAG